MHSVVLAIPIHNIANGFRVAVAQREGGLSFFRVSHAPDFGELLRPGEVGAELGEHATAGLDRRQLMSITDKDRLRPRLRGRGQELAQIVGADHAGFINYHQGVLVELQPPATQRVQCFGDGHAVVAGPFAHCDVDRLAGRRQDENSRPESVMRRISERPQRCRLARACRGTQWLNQPRRAADVLHCGLLIRRQPRGVLVAHPQHGAIIGRVDQIKYRGFFGQDPRQGEALAPFTFVRGARRG